MRKLIALLIVAAAGCSGLKTYPTDAGGNLAVHSRLDGGVKGALHIHQYLDLYINGQQKTVPPGTGIVNSAGCLYPLHAHDGEPNIIHNETDQHNVTFTLGQFFDIWGVKLSSAQVGNYQVDGSHKLVIKLVANDGTVTTYTGNPHDLKLSDQETIYLLYNSPHVPLKPFTDWQNLGE